MAGYIFPTPQLDISNAYKVTLPVTSDKTTHLLQKIISTINQNTASGKRWDFDISRIE